MTSPVQPAASMLPSSEAQHTALETGRIPALEKVRDDVWALGMSMPGEHLRYSLCYLLIDTEGGVHVVDPGWDLDANWSTLLAALDAIDRSPGDLRTVTATHQHADHLGMAQRIVDATPARLRLLDHEQRAIERLPASQLSEPELDFLLESWGVPAAARAHLHRTDRAGHLTPAAPASTFRDGEVLDIPGFRLTAIWTPGHTPGSVAFRDEDRSILFTGDHLLPMMFSGLGLGGQTTSNAVDDYLGSLERLRPFAADEVLPGHGYRFRGLSPRIDECSEHLLTRAREVARALADEPAQTIWELSSRITWTDGWTNLSGMNLLSALRQTAMHRDYVAGRPTAIS